MKTSLQFLNVRNAIFLLFALIAFPGFAQEQAADSIKTINMDEVVITGTRSETSIDKVPQKIEVISQHDISLTPSQEFTDLLKKNSSVDIIQYPGLLAGVGIRGFRPQISGINQRSLLLVNGRPAGTTNLATISTANIERIEVLKGPASALYGSQAMGGVINVITRKSQGPVGASVFADYGSFNTWQTGASAGGNITEKLDFDLSFRVFDRNENIRLGKGNLFRNMLNGDTYTKFLREGGQEEIEDSRGDGEKREYTKLNHSTTNVRLGYQLSGNWRIDISAERFLAKNVESPSDLSAGNTSPSAKDIERANGDVVLSGTLGRHGLSATAYHANETNGNKNLVSGGQPIVPYLSFQSQAAWQGLQLKDVITFQRHSIIIGSDITNATYTSRSFNSDHSERAPFNPNYSLQSLAAYAQGQLNFLEGRLVVNPGVRFDRITYNVKETPLLDSYVPGKVSSPFMSPNLGLQYQLLAPLRVHVTVGRAFVTPDAYNVAGYSEIVNNKAAAVTRGNPDLVNENSVTWDAGFRFDDVATGIAANVTYFSTAVRDRITRLTTSPASLEFTAGGDTIKSYTTFINVNEGTINGLEYELSYDFGALSNYKYSLRMFANATSILDARDITIGRDGTSTSRDIYNVSKFTSAYGLGFNNLRGFTARLLGRYVGNRKDTDFNDPVFPEIELPSFMLLDFATSYTYANQHTVTFFVNNLTDENYYEKRGFNLPGRNMSLRYTFNF